MSSATELYLKVLIVNKRQCQYPMLFRKYLGLPGKQFEEILLDTAIALCGGIINPGGITHPLCMCLFYTPSLILFLSPYSSLVKALSPLHFLNFCPELFYYPLYCSSSSSKKDPFSFPDSSSYSRSCTCI